MHRSNRTWLAFALVAGMSATAFGQPTDFDRLVAESSFVFRGEVTARGKSTVPIVKPDPATVTVRVRRIFKAPRSLRKFEGQEITVRLSAPLQETGRRSLLFFTNGWIYDKSVAVTGVARGDDVDDETLQKRIAAVAEAKRDEELARRLAAAPVVVTGRVVRTELSKLNERLPLTEHEPRLWEATVLVKTEEKGRAGDQITFVFSKGVGFMWGKSPRFKEGDEGIFILLRDEKPGLKLDQLTAFHPEDFRPLSELPRVRRLLRR